MKVTLMSVIGMCLMFAFPTTASAQNCSGGTCSFSSSFSAITKFSSEVCETVNHARFTFRERFNLIPGQPVRNVVRVVFTPFQNLRCRVRCR